MTHLQWSKGFSEFKPLVDVDVLVSKDKNPTFGNQESQIVLLGFRELRQLNAMDFSANMRGNVKDFGGIIVDRGFLGITTKATVFVFKRFQFRVLITLGDLHVSIVNESLPLHSYLFIRIDEVSTLFLS